MFPSNRPSSSVPNHNRGLVPQLWANYTIPTEPPAENVSCNVARWKCANRPGCSMALQNYALGCTNLVGDIYDGKEKKDLRGKKIGGSY